MSTPITEIAQLNIKSSDQNNSPTELLLKYFAYFPIFLASLGICFFVGKIYLRYVTPIYKSSTRILVISSGDNPNSGSSSSGGGDLIESAVYSTKRVNLDNEIALITSSPLIQKVVEKNKFNYYYQNEGSIRISELYTQVPFRVMVNHWADSSSEVNFRLQKLTAEGGLIQFGKKVKGKQQYQPFRWYQSLNMQGNSFSIYPNNWSPNIADLQYVFTWRPVKSTAGEILGNLSASVYNPKTTIIKLDLKSTNVSKANDILDAIAKEYNQQGIENKSLVLDNTLKFIGTRLKLITEDLGNVETGLKDFRNKNKVINLSQQSEQVLDSRDQLEQGITDILIQQRLLGLIKPNLASPKNLAFELIPVNLAKLDPVLATLVTKYNELVLLKQRQEPLLGKNSDILKDLNNQLQAAFNAVNDGFANLSQNLQIQLTQAQTSMARLDGVVGNVPNIEREMVEIKRQQNVKEGLYLYLFKKREETAITAASTVSSYRQIEPAYSAGQIEPNGSKIFMFSIIIGLLIPIAGIYVYDIFDDKVKSRDHITEKTKMPIISELGHVDKNGENLVVVDNSRDQIAEQFRVLRTNLNFMSDKHKTILVTSTVSGEGKSFVALNLAAVLAISSKKVALLEFDLRRPKITKNVGLQKRNVGITTFLSGQETTIDNLYSPIEGYPNLHIFGCGPIPPNPSELMVGNYTNKLFEALTLNYDYIIIDSAPVGLVSDAFNIMEYVDTSLYIVRQRKTIKKQLHFVDDLFKSNQIKNGGIVINDVKVGGRYGYYGHSYGSPYGYYNGYFEEKISKWSWRYWYKKMKKR